VFFLLRCLILGVSKSKVDGVHKWARKIIMLFVDSSLL
jgi:hypothetical protein